MSNEALRSVFAEFGFKIDDKALDALLDKTEKTIKAEKDLDKVQKKALGELKKRKAEEEKAAKAHGTLVGQLSKVHPALGKMAESAGVGGAHLSNMMVQSAGLGAALVGVAVSAHRFAVAFAADIEQLRESADAARVTAHEFQALSFAGGAAGVSASTTAGALNTLGQGLRAIESRTGGPTNALWRLGVRARNANGTMRETNDVLYDVADRFERVRNPVQRARLAQELFGANGRRMLTVLAGGSAALRRQHEDFEALGGGVLPEAVEAAQGFTAAQQRMKVASDSIRSVMATALLPVITAITNKVADFTGWLSRMTRGSNVVNVAMVALGVAGATAGLSILAAWLPTMLPFIGIGLLIGALILIVDDLVSLFNGGNSAIGEFIDSMLGVGAASEIVADLKQMWTDLGESIEWVIGKIAQVTGMTPSVAQGTLRPPQLGPQAAASAQAARDRASGANRARARPRSAAERAERAAEWQAYVSRPGGGARGPRPRPSPGAPASSPASGPAASVPAASDGAARIQAARERAARAREAITSGSSGTSGAPMTGAFAVLSAPAMATAPASGGTRTVHTTTHRVSSPQFHITGVTDPAEVARRVQQILQQQERLARDGRHEGED